MSIHPTRAHRFWEALGDLFRRPSPEQRIVRALQKDRLDEMEALIERHGWNVDDALTTYPPPPETDFFGTPLRRHHTGWRLLHLATCLDNLEAVERLVDAGAHVDVDTDWGMTPALQAASRGHAVLVDFLASRGADLERRIPSFSTFADDYVGPTVVEKLNQKSETPYRGGEYARARAKRLNETLPEVLYVAPAKARL